MGKIKDLRGLRFGNLTSLNQAGRTKYGQVLWECLCDCGKTNRNCWRILIKRRHKVLRLPSACGHNAKEYKTWTSGKLRIPYMECHEAAMRKP